MLRSALHGDGEVKLFRRIAQYLPKGKAHGVVLSHGEFIRGVGYGTGTVPQHRALCPGAGCEKTLGGHLSRILRKVYADHGILSDNAAGVRLDVRRKVLCTGRRGLPAAVSAA